MSLTSKPVRPSLRYFIMAFLYGEVSVLGKMFVSRLTSISGSQDFRLVALAPCQRWRGRPALGAGSDRPLALSIPNWLLAGFSIPAIQILRSQGQAWRCLMNLDYKDGGPPQ